MKSFRNPESKALDLFVDSASQRPLHFGMIGKGSRQEIPKKQLEEIRRELMKIESEQQNGERPNSKRKIKNPNSLSKRRGSLNAKEEMEHNELA